MKRNPRWMMVFAIVVILSSWVPRGASAIIGPIALPEPGIRMIGEPEGGSGGKTYRVPPGMYFILPLAGSAWTVRLSLPTTLLRPRLPSSALGWQLSSHDRSR